MTLTDIVENRIFVMNLKHRTDRLQNSIDEFKKLGIDNYNIIESYSPTSEIPQQYLDRINKYKEKNPKYNIPQNRECLKITVTEVMRIALEKNYPNILYFEDDFMFKDNYKEILPKALEQLMEREWDMFKLGGNYTVSKGRVEKETDNLLRVYEKVWGAHAQIINRNIIKYIYDNMLEFNGHNDTFLANDAHLKYKCYLCYPCVCTQIPGYSDLNKYYYNPSRELN